MKRNFKERKSKEESRSMKDRSREEKRRKEGEIIERSDSKDWIEAGRGRRMDCGRYIVR